LDYYFTIEEYNSEGGFADLPPLPQGDERVSWTHEADVIFKTLDHIKFLDQDQQWC